MDRTLIAYASRYGHARSVAEALAETMKSRGLRVDLHDVLSGRPIEVRAYQAAVLCASVHLGKYGRKVDRFVRAHASDLAQIPTAFISVCMAASPHNGSEGLRQARETVERFIAATRWRPDRIELVAGELAFTRYGLIVRAIMK